LVDVDACTVTVSFIDREDEKEGATSKIPEYGARSFSRRGRTGEGTDNEAKALWIN
jgi:hypothetical protein